MKTKTADQIAKEFRKQARLYDKIANALDPYEVWSERLKKENTMKLGRQLGKRR